MKCGKKSLLKLNIFLLCLGSILFCLVSQVRLSFVDQKILFSKTDSFYEGSIEVELSGPEDGTIYYTLDGSVPDENAQIYKEPIPILEMPEGEVAQTVRAVAVSPEGEQTSVFTHTYFVGQGIRERFSTLVLAVTCDPYNLYDYNYGIFVPGRLRAVFEEANPDVEVSSNYPANYNLRGRESERDAHVEILESDGTLIIDQDVGLRIHGGTTRAAEQKSMKLFARSEYGENQFHYAFFPEGENWQDGEVQSIYRRILLRNNGNDYADAYLRDECVQRLAKEAGYLDTQESRPAAVFLNGEYYGFEWLKEVYDDTYFHENYGTDPWEGSWEVVELKDREAREDDASGSRSVQAVEEWNLVAALAGQDFQDDAVFQSFCDQVDLDGFMLYCAIEIYFANPDWPINNCKVYRWYSANESYKEGPTDGKWRFLLYDMDNTMGLNGYSFASDHSLAQVLNMEQGDWKRFFPLFTALMQREDMRKEFRDLIENLMDTTFSQEHICQVMEEIRMLRQEELQHHMEMRSLSGQAAIDEQSEEIEKSLQQIRYFAKDRPQEMRMQLDELGF